MFLACPQLDQFMDKTATNAVSAMSESGDLLPRWRGIARLFGALCVGHAPSFLNPNKRQNIFTPSLLWRIIAGMVNQPFVPCATAEVKQYALLRNFES